MSFPHRPIRLAPPHESTTSFGVVRRFLQSEAAKRRGSNRARTVAGIKHNDTTDADAKKLDLAADVMAVIDHIPELRDQIIPLVKAYRAHMPPFDPLNYGPEL